MSCENYKYGRKSQCFIQHFLGQLFRSPGKSVIQHIWSLFHVIPRIEAGPTKAVKIVPSKRVLCRSWSSTKFTYRGGPLWRNPSKNELPPKRATKISSTRRTLLRLSDWGMRKRNRCRSMPTIQVPGRALLNRHYLYANIRKKTVRTSSTQSAVLSLARARQFL